MAEFPHLHHQLHFLLVAKSLVNKDVLDVLSLWVDLKVLLLESVLWSCLLSTLQFFFLVFLLVTLNLLLLLTILLLTSWWYLGLISHHLLLDILNTLSSLHWCDGSLNASLSGDGAHVHLGGVRWLAHLGLGVVRLVHHWLGGRFSATQGLELGQLSSRALLPALESEPVVHFTLLGSGRRERGLRWLRVVGRAVYLRELRGRGFWIHHHRFGSGEAWEAALYLLLWAIVMILFRRWLNAWVVLRHTWLLREVLLIMLLLFSSCSLQLLVHGQLLLADSTPWYISWLWSMLVGISCYSSSSLVSSLWCHLIDLVADHISHLLFLHVYLNLHLSSQFLLLETIEIADNLEPRLQDDGSN